MIGKLARRERAVSNARDAFLTAIRIELDNLRPSMRCAPTCPGWIVSESDKYGTRIEICDECSKARKADGGAVLFDQDVAMLPEAERALDQALAEIREFENARNLPTVAKVLAEIEHASKVAPFVNEDTLARWSRVLGGDS